MTEEVASVAIDVSTPAIVLGIDTQIGLWLVRELGRAGVAVHGVTSDPNSIGLRSRYLTRGHVLPGNEAELMAGLLALGRTLGKTYLLAISEPHLEMINRHRKALGKLEALTPTESRLFAVLDKATTLTLARECGIDVPRTWTIASMLDEISPDARFPVVLKWSDPNRVYGLLRKYGLPLHKAEFVTTKGELHAALGRYSVIGEFPMIQEYVPGHGFGQCVFMHEGKAIRMFQHRRLREWPPEGGFSTACEAVPLTQHRDLMERSIELLRRIDWAGAAMVEYRFDPRTGRAVLMEINGRFWGSIPLACHCGAQFALLTYAVLGNRNVPALPPPRSNLVCRMATTELKRLVRVVLQPGKIADPSFQRRPVMEILNFLAAFFSPRTRYYIYSADDPKPFWQDLRNVLATRVLRVPT